MNTHKITAVRSGSHPTMGDWDAEYEITFSYVRGSRDDLSVWPPEPGWAAEIEFVSITPDAGDHGAFSDIAQKWLVDWAVDWLDEHHDECVESAEQDMQPDPDAARDARIDDELTGRASLSHGGIDE